MRGTLAHVCLSLAIARGRSPRLRYCGDAIAAVAEGASAHDREGGGRVPAVGSFPDIIGARCSEWPPAAIRGEMMVGRFCGVALEWHALLSGRSEEREPELVSAPSQLLPCLRSSALLDPRRELSC